MSEPEACPMHTPLPLRRLGLPEALGKRFMVEILHLVGESERDIQARVKILQGGEE